MQKQQIHFDPTNLRKLVEAENGDIHDMIDKRSARIFANETGIPFVKLRAYALGEVVPPLEDLMKIAVYFAVPLDFLTGRCSQSVAEHILKHYATFMRELLGVDMSKLERRLYVINESWDCNPNEFPWPYNLMLAVNDGDPIDHQVTDDVMQGIDKALQVLDDKCRKIILMHFRDGMTLREIGKAMGFTRSRAGMLVTKSLHKLRLPNAYFCLMYGCEYADRNSELRERRAELEEEARFLKKWGKELDSRLAAYRNEAKEITTRESAVQYEERRRSVYFTDIRELGLSARAYNSLRKSLPDRDGEYTLGDIFDIASRGELLRMRNCGKKTATEILDLIYEKTGISLYEQNGL